MEIVMTRRGRELFMEGKFKPASYDFFDDDICYDPHHKSGLMAETEQNRIVPDIKEIPVLKNQNDWLGATHNFKEHLEPPYLNKPLGKSSNFNKNKPAWKVKVKEGYISDPVEFTAKEFVGTAVGEEKIPQINVVCEYTSSIKNGSYKFIYDKSSDDLYIEIKEENVESSVDNFDLQIFRTQNAAGNQVLEPLKFSQEEYGPKFAEYFFNTSFDAAADQTLFVRYVDDDKEMGPTIETDECAQSLTCASKEIKKLKNEIAATKANQALAEASEKALMAKATADAAAAKKAIKAAQSAAAKAVKDYKAAIEAKDKAAQAKALEELKEIKKATDEAIKGTVKNGGNCADHGFGGAKKGGMPNNEKCKSGNCQKPAGHDTWICVGKDCPDCGLDGDYCGNNNECKSGNCAPTQGTKKKKCTSAGNKFAADALATAGWLAEHYTTTMKAPKPYQRAHWNLEGGMWQVEFWEVTQVAFAPARYIWVKAPTYQLWYGPFESGNAPGSSISWIEKQVLHGIASMTFSGAGGSVDSNGVPQGKMASFAALGVINRLDIESPAKKMSSEYDKKPWDKQL